MADLTIKAIEEVLDKKLDQKLGPIKKKQQNHDKQFKSIAITLDGHSKKLGGHDSQFKSITKRLDEHSSQFKSVTRTLDEHSQRLESLMLDMVDVQKKTDILPDIYDLVKGTKEKVDDHEERIQVLESAA